MQRRGGLAAAAGVLSLASLAAQAAPPPCPYQADLVSKVVGLRVAAGQAEPGIGGTSCKYAGQNGGPSLWVLVLPPGSDQAMMRTMTAGGPKARFEPIAGDPDGAARVRSPAGDGVVDLSYTRGGYVVFVRASGMGHEPDAKTRAARDDALAAKLLKLPRIP
ncbi:hypothetical protein ABXN37_12485 [Piscinibacter sakaiensis]